MNHEIIYLAALLYDTRHGYAEKERKAGFDADAWRDCVVDAIKMMDITDELLTASASGIGPLPDL